MWPFCGKTCWIFRAIVLVVLLVANFGDDPTASHTFADDSRTISAVHVPVLKLPEMVSPGFAAVQSESDADQLPSAHIGQPNVRILLPLETRKATELLGQSTPQNGNQVAGATQSPGSGQQSQDGEKAPKESWNHVAVFNNPCHFAIHQHGNFGQSFQTSSLVIYEGMQIAIEGSGRYRLKFQAEVPRTAVIMRLQLQLWLGQDNQLGTITLPPLSFDPGTDLSRYQVGQTVDIQHDGFSYALKTLIGPSPQFASGISQLQFRRTGVARFGSIPDKGEYAIRPIDNNEEKDAAKKSYTS